MATHSKVLGLTLDPKLHTAHTSTTSQYKHTNLQIHKSTTWGKQKETLMATYKAVMRPALDMPLLYGRLLHPRPA